MGLKANIIFACARLVSIATFLADVSQFKEHRKQFKGHGTDDAEVTEMNETHQRVITV